MYLVLKCATHGLVVTSSRMLRVSYAGLGTPFESQKREYHDESFGYRPPPRYVFPDCESLVFCEVPCLVRFALFSICDVFQKCYDICDHVHLFSVTDTEKQLINRDRNAPLLRYVDSMRTHGHRAARIDPLDLIAREEVVALNPVRYGLVDGERKYDVDGILWTKRVGEERNEKEDIWSLDEIEGHLRSVYIGNIGYEVGCWFFLFSLICLVR